MHIVAGVDLGGTAVNYTLVDYEGRFLIDGLCEHPARAVEGPDVCLKQTVEGLNVAVTRAGASLSDVTYVGLDTPGPASAVDALQKRFRLFPGMETVSDECAIKRCNSFTV